MKHILVISQCFYPEQFRINDICQEWIKRGYQVTAVTGIPNYPEGRFYSGYGYRKKRRENWNGIDIIHLPLIPRGKHAIGLILNYLSFPVAEYFWNLTTDIEPDYIFMFETSPMTQCVLGVWLKKKLAKKGKHIPLYLYVQDLWPENVEIVTGIRSPIIIKPIEKMVAYIYKNCDVIFATSPSFVKEIQKRCEDKNKVKYWSQYAEEFYVPVSREEARKRVPEIVKKDTFKIIFTGNIGQAQGLEILPKLAKLFKGTVKRKVEFVVVGDGRNKKQFEQALRENNVEDMFVMIARQPTERIPDMLACCDAAFLSFMDDALFYKTIPAKLQSYMACGMPIIALAKGETARIIREAACGVCCDIGNVEGLYREIERLMQEDKAALVQMGKNARASFEKHFEKQMLMNEIEKYFRVDEISQSNKCVFESVELKSKYESING